MIKANIYSGITVTFLMLGGLASHANAAAIVDSCLGLAGPCAVNLGTVDTAPPGGNTVTNQTFSIDEGNTGAGLLADIDVSFTLAYPRDPFSAITLETGSGFQISTVSATWGDVTDSVNGQNRVFTITANPTPLAAGTYLIEVAGTTGGCPNENCNAFNVRFDGELAEVPIPAAAWLFGSGLIGLAGIARKRKAS